MYKAQARAKRALAFFFDFLQINHASGPGVIFLSRLFDRESLVSITHTQPYDCVWHGEFEQVAQLFPLLGRLVSITHRTLFHCYSGVWG